MEFFVLLVTVLFTFVSFPGYVSTATSSHRCTILRKVDLAVLVQLNDSLVGSTVEDVKDYIKLTLQPFLVDNEHTRIALLQFSPNPVIEWKFGEHKNREEFDKAVDNLTIKTREMGNLSEALYFATYPVWHGPFGARSSDSTVEKILIAITNSPRIPDSEVIKLADSFSTNGISAYVVCVDEPCEDLFQPPLVARRDAENPLSGALAARLQESLGCDPCHPDPCEGRGKCQQMESNNSYVCHCFPSFSGLDCEVSEETDVLACKHDQDVCNSGTCVAGSMGSYACSCPFECSGFHCEECDIAEIDNFANLVCSPNPCLNDCFCVPASRRSGGYYCISSKGYTGKYCSIPLPDVECWSDQIIVRVSKELVEEFDFGLNNSYLYIAPELDTPAEATCRAYLSSGGELMVTIASPFTSCLKAEDDRDFVVLSSSVWIGREVSTAYDFPIPVASFQCKYERNYTMIEAISPTAERNELLIKSEGEYDASAVMCKVDNQCAHSCPIQYVIHDEARYSVGEMVHLKMKLSRGRAAETQLGTTIVLTHARLTCGSDAGLTLVDQGCRTAAIPTIISMDAASDSVCLSFQTPRMKRCQKFYIDAVVRITPDTVLQPCTDGGGLTTFQPQKRSTESNNSIAEEQRLIIGPVLIDDRLEKSVRIFPNAWRPTSSSRKDWTRIHIVIAVGSVALTSVLLFGCLLQRFCIKNTK